MGGEHKTTWVMFLVGATTVACGAKGPPSNLRPSPEMSARVQSIRIVPRASTACPGSTVSVDYIALFQDGTEMPFSKAPVDGDVPPLHVGMLSLVSSEATAGPAGDWEVASDPLVSLTTGFRLSATLKGKPAATGSLTLAPEYQCLPTYYAFAGPDGDDARNRSSRRTSPSTMPTSSRGRTSANEGGTGPEVTVRLIELRSPFVDRLVVASIEVDGAAPIHVFGDRDRLPAAGWITVESRGGKGGRGAAGDTGPGGNQGTPGCPGGRGGPGQRGGSGHGGARGGNGGPIRMVTPPDDQSLVALVLLESVPGRGGAGGQGGRGGPGGAGGRASGGGAQCAAGPSGSPGPSGDGGLVGEIGLQGPPTQMIAVPRMDVLGPRVHPTLAELLVSGR